jgi:predicted transcriptional regulator of viral defense system
MKRSNISPSIDLHALFLAHGGYLTSGESRGYGVHPEQLARLVEQGDAERVQRGVYRLIDDTVPFGAAEELLEIQLRVPYARPCLISALHLHGLTTTRPVALQFAVPFNRSVPTIASPATEVFYFRPRFYGSGTLEFPVASRLLTTYTPEKTLVDLLRYAPKYGREIYLEGLKNYLLRVRGQGTRALLDEAGTGAVGLTLRHDLEVLSHDQDH